MIFRFSAVTILALSFSVANSEAKRQKNTNFEKPCYDYSNVFGELGYDECNERKLFQMVKAAFHEQDKLTDEKCVGGVKRDLEAITNTVGQGNDAAHQALKDLCTDALMDASDVAITKKATFEYLESEPHAIDLEEYFLGAGPLNNETGNFQQDPKQFQKKGGYDKFLYIGEDPRLNDHYPTSEVSYAGGEAIYKFYENEAQLSYLTAPTLDFERGCDQTHAAVCCWHRDRQYFDNNGNCGSSDCANQAPGDNTDLCWMEDTDEGVVAYPEDDVEGDLHCHGFSWSKFEETYGDVNTNAKWNNLFYVSMYDHLYTRGYADAITDDPNIAGEVPMCGCVEDMSSKIARADCTEAVGRTNYTANLNDDGHLEIVHKPDTFNIEFRACQGFDYDESITPKQFQNEYNYNREDAGLERSDNDLSAFIFKQYLKGKIDEAHVEEFEKTIVGYRDPSVNEGDEERQALCKAKFEEKFGKEYPAVENK